MKQQVDPMITSRIQSPQRVLDAKRAVDQRKILRRRIERKPDAPQTIRRSQQFVIRYIHVIVPDKAAIPRGPIRKNRQGCQNQGKEPGATAFGSDESRNIAQHCCIERDSRRRSATEIVQLQAVLFHRRNSFRGA